MNDMDAMTFCDNFFTATEGTPEPKGITAQLINTQALRTDAWVANGPYTAGGTGLELDADEFARRVAEEIKGQLDIIVRPEIEGKYKLKHR